MIIIAAYRGDRAFCSQECRDQEMLLEEMKNPKKDDAIYARAAAV